MKNKNVLIVLLGLLFVAVAVLGTVVIQQKQKITVLNDQLIVNAKKAAEPTPTPVPQPKMFTSQEYGFSLTVLPGWVATEKKNETCGIPNGIVKPGTCTELVLEKGTATLALTYKKSSETGQINPSGFGAYTTVSKEDITFNGKPMTVNYQTDVATDAKVTKEITNVAINNNNIVKLTNGMSIFISYTEKPSTKFATAADKPETLKEALTILSSFSEK